jgi:hypothetical protein
VLVEGVSEEIERLLVDCFGEGPDRLEVDGSDSGISEGGSEGCEGGEKAERRVSKIVQSKK